MYYISAFSLSSFNYLFFLLCVQPEARILRHWPFEFRKHRTPMEFSCHERKVMFTGNWLFSRIHVLCFVSQRLGTIFVLELQVSLNGGKGWGGGLSCDPFAEWVMGIRRTQSKVSWNDGRVGNIRDMGKSESWKKGQVQSCPCEHEDNYPATVL